MEPFGDWRDWDDDSREEARSQFHGECENCGGTVCTSQGCDCLWDKARHEDRHTVVHVSAQLCEAAKVAKETALHLLAIQQIVKP